MKNYKLLQNIVFALFIICNLSACHDNANSYNENSLNLVEPVEIINWALFADGGSTQITFKDSSGKELTFYYDLSGEGPKTNRHIYIGVISQDNENSKQVQIDSQVEKEIIKYVSNWMNKNYPDYHKKTDQMYMSSDGKLITSTAILTLIGDLQERNQ